MNRRDFIRTGAAAAGGALLLRDGAVRAQLPRPASAARRSDLVAAAGQAAVVTT